MCGVALKCGDDVIKIDKCPLAGQTLDAYPIVNTLYTNNALTPSFRIFQELDGARFKVGII